MSARLTYKTLQRVKTLREEQMAELNNELAEIVNKYSATLEPQDVLAVLGYLARRMEKVFDQSKEIG